MNHHSATQNQLAIAKPEMLCLEATQFQSTRPSDRGHYGQVLVRGVKRAATLNKAKQGTPSLVCRRKMNRAGLICVFSLVTVFRPGSFCPPDAVEKECR